MDQSFPPGFPTLTGDLLEINRFLSMPTMIYRALRTLTQQRFIADVIFKGRATPSGGAILYEQMESIYPDRPVESVAPGGKFPLSTTSRGPAKIATVQKWGIDSKVTLEDTQRLAMNPVERSMRKLANGVVRQVDSNALALLLNSALTPIQTIAGSPWGTAGDAATIVQQISQAISNIASLNQGYKADTLVINDTTQTNMVSNQRISNMLRRENPDNPIYTGFIGRILGLDTLVTNNVAGFSDSTAAGSMTAIVLDSQMMGGMADEVALQTASWWIPDTEEWRLRAKRQTVPWVMEPGAVCSITGI